MADNENEGPTTCPEFESAARVFTINLITTVLRAEAENNEDEVLDLLGEISSLLWQWDQMLSQTRLLHVSECLAKQDIVERALFVIANVWRDSQVEEDGQPIQLRAKDRQSLQKFLADLTNVDGHDHLVNILNNNENITIADLLNN